MSVNNIAVAAKAAPLLGKALKLAKDTLKDIDEKKQYALREAHIAYCENVVRKFCRARTFFVRNEPQFIEDFYVPASLLKNYKESISRANLTSLRKVSPRCVVTGSGGSGKTVFMRYLLLDSIERGVGYPVFIELRNLNDVENVKLEDVIVEFMTEHGFPLGADYVLRSLKEGLLTVLLDGFDEVAFSKRKALQKAIKRLGAGNASQIVLSSRPDMDLEGWDGFATVSVAPLALDDACELIEKIKFDDDDGVKERFVARLRDGLFESHRYFLSNPLLLSIMLLTYGDSADIPRKFATFYEQAYSALFQKHDALKAGFRRERRTTLDIFEFARLFSAFSAITYSKRSFRFSLPDAVSAVNDAKRLVGNDSFDSEGFLDDARQAVCLLIEDGLDLSYVHRSFQEYFVARFVNDSDGVMQKNYIESFCLPDGRDFGFNTDRVLAILYEMNPALVEEAYLLPSLERLFGAASTRRLTLSSWKKIFKKVVRDLHLDSSENPSVSFVIKNRAPLEVFLFLRDNCFEHQRAKSHKQDPQLIEFLTGKGSLAVKDISESSPVWKMLSQSGGIFSMSYLETARLELSSMRKRLKDRKAAAGDIFSFK